MIVTPGNHDSAVRLGFGAELFTDRLHVRTRLADAADPVLLSDEHGSVAVYPLPYLDAEEVRQFARQADDIDLPRSQAAASRYVMDRVRADLDQRPSTRAVVMAHAFVVDADDPGDAGLLFRAGQRLRARHHRGRPRLRSDQHVDGVAYVALGHLHGAQTRRQSACGTVVEYSAPPLRFSFSERNHVKG